MSEAWKLVPVEPTDEMMEAFYEGAEKARDEALEERRARNEERLKEGKSVFPYGIAPIQWFPPGYASLLAASPVPPAGDEGLREEIARAVVRARGDNPDRLINGIVAIPPARIWEQQIDIVDAILPIIARITQAKDAQAAEADKAWWDQWRKQCDRTNAAEDQVAKLEAEVDRRVRDNIALEGQHKADVADLEAQVERLKNELGDPDGTIAHADSITKVLDARIAQLEAQVERLTVDRDHWKYAYEARVARDRAERPDRVRQVEAASAPSNEANETKEWQHRFDEMSPAIERSEVEFLEELKRRKSAPNNEVPEEIRALSEAAYEIANQAGGYVDVTTPKREAEFLLKIEKMAAALGDDLRARLSAT